MIQKAKNNRLLENKENNINVIVDQIKIHVWQWIKVQVECFDYDFNFWWKNLLKCIGYLDHILVLLMPVRKGRVSKR